MKHLNRVIGGMVLTAFAAAAQAQPAQAGKDYIEGLRAFTGDGVPQDYARAAQLYRNAASQGHRYAQYGLALIYDHGYGVAPNRNEAVRWYRAAAERGEAKANTRLAMLGVQAPPVSVAWDHQPLLPATQGASWNAPVQRIPVQTAAYAPAAASAGGLMQASYAPFTVSPARPGSYAAVAAAPDAVPGGYSAAAPAAVSAEAASAVQSYQAALVTQDYSTALRALEALRTGNQLGALGLASADTSLELARLASLSDDRSLAEQYFQEAALQGVPEAQTALNALANGQNLSALAGTLDTRRLTAGLSVLQAAGIDTGRLTSEAVARYGNKLPGGLAAGAAAMALAGDVDAAKNAATELAKKKAKELAMQKLAAKAPIPFLGSVLNLFGGSDDE